MFNSNETQFDGFMESIISHEYRCSCGKLLFKGAILSGSMEIKCLRCGKISKMGDLNTGLEEEPGQYSLLLNSDGTIINASSSATKVLFYTRDEFLGKKYFNLSTTITEELFKRIFGILERREAKEIYYHQGVHLMKDGKKLPVRIRLKGIQIGDEFLLLCLTNYINAPAENLTFQKFAVENVCDGYVELSPNFIITSVAGKYKELLGYEVSEMLGHRITEFALDDDLKRVRRAFNIFLRDKHLSA